MHDWRVRCRWWRFALAQELVRDVERGHHRDAVDAGGFTRAANLAHPLVEKGDGLEQVGALLLLAGDLVVAPEKVDVERDRLVGGFAAHSDGMRAISASSRAPACCTLMFISRLRSIAVARSRRSDSFAARSARVCAMSVASFCSRRARSASIASILAGRAA